MEPILRLKKVSFAYEDILALRDIDLDILPGEILGILGPNGSGKSTLLRLMDGVLFPQKGEILLKGRPTHSCSRLDIAQKVALVAQESHFRFSFSALEVVLMGRFAHLRGSQFERKQDMAVAVKALKAVDALELARRPIHALSGGEKQRILLARALTQEPSVVLLDEPTSFLDLHYKKEIFDLISALAYDTKLSVVVVSHDIDLTARYCDRMVIMKAGQIYSVGPPVEVVTEKTIEAVYGCPVIVDNNPATLSPRVNLR
jgi:iron complex transport system ATP-binding protein